MCVLQLLVAPQGAAAPNVSVCVCLQLLVAPGAPLSLMSPSVCPDLTDCNQVVHIAYFAFVARAPVWLRGGTALLARPLTMSTPYREASTQLWLKHGEYRLYPQQDRIAAGNVLSPAYTVSGHNRMLSPLFEACFAS